MAHPSRLPDPPTPPMWAAPAEYGQPAATDAKNGVAAPLLAGFSIALLASVGQAPSSFRWPGAVILVLLLVVAAFVLSIQLGFRSRARLYSRADALAWGPVNDLPAEQDEEIRARIQRAHLASWFRAQRWVQLAYNTAIGLLGLALTLVAAPPTSYGGGAAVAGSEAAWRWTAFGVGLLLTGLEVGWILRDEYRRLRARRTPTGASGGEGSAT